MTRRPLLPTTDPHVLYQEAVQSPEVDVRLIDRHFRRIVGRPATTFREDFCGTALLACAWVGLGRERRAVAIDLDRPTLRWGERHNLARLPEAARTRIDLVHADVLEVRRPKADIVAALNFSYCVFKTRPQMLAYVRNALRSLNPGGLLVLDVWGGSDTQTAHADRRRVRGMTYVWDQVSFDPVSYHADCRIHFEFPDGRKRRNAFAYDWRLWTLPELRDLLDEAGFADIHVLWESADAKGRGTGRFRRIERAGPERSWIAYIVGRA
jgi:SAM-dependent methyltransferase